jgi:putative AdoMet-dependent methyltransferase
MKSAFGDRFNHDRRAATYDENVRNESNPVRTGYRSLLNSIASRVRCGSRVLELGCGTGNLTMMLQASEHTTAVDISAAMMEVAKTKTVDQPVSYCQDDILTFVEQATEPYDYVLSTYTLHHLTPAEKSVVFERCYELLNPGGVALFGDLMFEDADARLSLREQFRQQGIDWLLDIMNKEFYWDIGDSLSDLQRIGFACATERFSDLSWVIQATKSESATTQS